MEKKDNIQLFGTSSLCFDKDVFMRPEFSVDDFMREYQCNGDGNLEMLRDHLGIYLKILRSAMIDLINRDYADFVNLSSNLSGLDSLIQTLSVPLGQLREEVLSVSQLLKSVSSGVLSDIEKQENLHKYRKKLLILSEITNRLDSMESFVGKYFDDGESDNKVGESEESADDLDRPYENLCLEACSKDEMLNCLVSGLSYLNYQVKVCENSSMVKIYQPRLVKLQSVADQIIEQNIIRSLSSSKDDVDLLKKTLIACSALDCSSVAENAVMQVITPTMCELVSENSMKSNPRGLTGVLNNVLLCVQKKLYTILRLTLPQIKNNVAVPEVVPGFKFLENSVFPVVANAVSNLPDFFSPANPTLFHQKYEQCINFIVSFEEMMVTKQRVETFRSSSSYCTFMEKWNFPVYFQIRNQEIGQVVESAFCEGLARVDPVKLEKGSLIFQSSKSVLRGIQQCWMPEVFLQPLLHRFWKMTLLILSRHRTWLSETVESINKSGFTDSSFKSSTKLSFSAEISLYLISDLLSLQTSIRELFSKNIKEHLSEETHQTLLFKTLTAESDKVKPFIDALIVSLKSNILSSMTNALQPVTDTPRLYRRTNRSAPSHAQPYIATSVAPLIELSKCASSFLPEDTLTKCYSDICSSFTSQYYALTSEVLESVLKTEESLKRLKRARKGGASSTSFGGGLSDEDKIREQLYQDVRELSNLLEKDIGVDVSELPDLIKLSTIVSEARNISEK